MYFTYPQSPENVLSLEAFVDSFDTTDATTRQHVFSLVNVRTGHDSGRCAYLRVSERQRHVAPRPRRPARDAISSLLGCVTMPPPAVLWPLDRRSLPPLLRRLHRRHRRVLLPRQHCPLLDVFLIWTRTQTRTLCTMRLLRQCTRSTRTITTCLMRYQQALLLAASLIAKIRKTEFVHTSSGC